jgi:hypothetical protein
VNLAEEREALARDQHSESLDAVRAGYEAAISDEAERRRAWEACAESQLRDAERRAAEAEDVAGQAERRLAEALEPGAATSAGTSAASSGASRKRQPPRAHGGADAPAREAAAALDAVVAVLDIGAQGPVPNARRAEALAGVLRARSSLAALTEELGPLQSAAAHIGEAVAEIARQRDAARTERKSHKKRLAVAKKLVDDSESERLRLRAALDSLARDVSTKLARATEEHSAALSSERSRNAAKRDALRTRLAADQESFKHSHARVTQRLREAEASAGSLREKYRAADKALAAANAETARLSEALESSERRRGCVARFVVLVLVLA